MHWLLFLWLLSVPLPSTSLISKSQSSEVQEIDTQLRELKEMKRGYEARALRHENYAEYLQFEGQAYLETRRHIELAEENRQKAAKVQQEIDRLEARRAKIVGRSSL